MNTAASAGEGRKVVTAEKGRATARGSGRGRSTLRTTATQTSSQG